MRATPSMVRNWSNYPGNVSSFSIAGTYPWAHYERCVTNNAGGTYGTFGWEANAEL
jgi:hypothetical protein